MIWRSLAVATLVFSGCVPEPAACPEAPAPTCSEPIATTAPAGAAPSEFEQVTVPPRPDWTDKYAHLNVGDMRFFDIDGLMELHGLSRASALEVQNHFRDLSRRGDGTADDWFSEALARAKKGEFEDRRDVEALSKAPFIVAFDLDETLYDQYYPPEIGKSCHDVAIPTEKGARYLQLAPGWDGAIRRIRELGGAVVLFSANTDDRTIENLKAMKLDGKPLTEHPDISAILTNSHLILQTKKRGTPVVEPSKDLRVFDETLTRIIIVDDNPTRLFQHDRVRVTPDLDAEVYCKSDTASPARRLIDRTLPEVVREIEESERYRQKTGVDFATAFLPYSETGRRWVSMAVAAGMSRGRAITWLREHPDAAD